MVKLFGKKIKESKEVSKNKNIAKNETIIIIKRLMGQVPITVATFKATLERDNDFNLVLVNKDVSNFKEDVSITKNKLIDMLRYKLDFSGKTMAEKIKVIDLAITEQEKILKDIKTKDADDDLQTTNNIIDEDYRLCTLKTLRFTVKNESEGSYEEINEEGYKQMMYLSIDGIFYPYFHSSTNITLYPDISSKRKIHKERQDMVEQDYLNENKGLFSGWFLTIFKFLLIGIFILNIYWTFDLNTTRSEFENMLDSSAYAEMLESAEGSAIKCAGYLAHQIDTNKDLIDFAIDNLNNTMEKNIKDGNKIDLG